MRAAAAAVAATILVLGATSWPRPGTAGAEPGGEAGGGGSGLIVAFDDAAGGERRAAHRAAGATRVASLDAIGAEVVTVRDPHRAAAAYRARGSVRFVEPDHTVHALAEPTDSEYDQQWNLHPAGPDNPASLNWEPVWSSRAALGAGVKVAVVDSGFRAGGTDEPLHVNTTDDWDYVHGDDTADDEHGHGTHVIGTIAQRTDDGYGVGPASGPSVAGVAPDAEIVAIKVLDHTGAGPISIAIRGLQRAIDIGADVINLSLGGRYSRAFCEAVAVASQQAVVVAASGNESTPGGWSPVAWPAACPGAIAVGGLALDGTRAPYSNAGCALSVGAPGGHPQQRRPDGSPAAILQESFDKDGFGFFYDSGTSMAAAHVSGAAAVLLSQTPRPSVADVRRALVATARDLGPAGVDPSTGTGAADLDAALSALTTGSIPTRPRRTGYWQVGADGGIFAFGDAGFHGSTGGIALNSPIVGMAGTPSGEGYWLVASDGGIFAFGDARFHGSTGGFRLNRPIVGIATTPTGGGYWLTASDGGIFAFGDAPFHGSTGAIALKAPVVGMRPTPTGLGYWLVAADGGIFAFGDAPFHGSTGALSLNRPITGMAVTLSGQGYWLTATDGGIFAFGDAPFRGSTGNIELNSPVVGMNPTCRGGGYWLVAADGGMFAFGDAPFLGSTGSTPLSRPIVSMARSIDMG